VTNRLFSSLPTTIFEVMSSLAREHQAVNLGQGFPDDPGPLDIREAAADAAVNGYNQYSSMLGLPELREAVVAHYGRRQGLKLDPSQVIITCGATEALAASFLGLIEPGDEVVLFQPQYDCYAPMVRRAGGVPRFVNLAPPNWTITPELLAEAFSDRTRLVVFNNPLNPSAVVHGPDELKALAEACIRHDVIAICDEVWEELVFAPHVFTPLYALPGMEERCVKIGSAGKIFSLTGWKIGWTIAAPKLTSAIAKAHQFLTFTIAPPLQAAVAYGLTKPQSYYSQMQAGFATSRDRLAAGLSEAGFAVLPSAGTYFLNLDLPASGIAMPDHEFCLLAVRQAGVAAIPVSAFYDQNPVTSVLRLCFAKRDETLDAGIERLSKARLLAAG
jgi:aspartate/methionine/tyrosine aminotransferase